MQMFFSENFWSKLCLFFDNFRNEMTEYVRSGCFFNKQFLVNCCLSFKKCCFQLRSFFVKLLGFKISAQVHGGLIRSRLALNCFKLDWGMLLDIFITFLIAKYITFYITKRGVMIFKKLKQVFSIILIYTTP